MNMLRRVETYITWGTPNLKSVKELIYKRGYGKVRRAPACSHAHLGRATQRLFRQGATRKLSVLCAWRR